MPIGAPIASAANIAIPVQDIDMPARCGPTEAIDQDTQPVTNWLSPNPAARRPAMMRRATDLPVPGSPATRAKPPSWTSCSTRQAKLSMAGVTRRASLGSSGENGFHLRPHEPLRYTPWIRGDRPDGGPVEHLQARLRRLEQRFEPEVSLLRHAA